MACAGLLLLSGVQQSAGPSSDRSHKQLTRSRRQYTCPVNNASPFTPVQQQVAELSPCRSAVQSDPDASLSSKQPSLEQEEQICLSNNSATNKMIEQPANVSPDQNMQGQSRLPVKTFYGSRGRSVKRRITYSPPPLTVKPKKRKN